MKIWIDISNAPHVNFFKDFIIEWQEKHDVFVTTRDLSNTIGLLEKNNIDYTIIGSHYGKNIYAKFIGFFKRSKALYDFLKFKKIDIAIAQSAFNSPYVAKRLKIPSIFTNDNEFAMANYFGFLFASHVLLPEALKKWVKGRFFEKRVSFYPGVKEGIYINQIIQKTNLEKLTRIYFRPEPWHAQYHDFDIDTFDHILIDLAKRNKIVILPRDDSQKNHYKQLLGKYSNIEIQIMVDTVEVIAEKCDIFLGAGGSMTREFAIMGIPTVSMYQGTLLEVDKYLIKNGVLISEKDPVKINQNFIDQLKERNDSMNKSYKIILEKGKQARIIINELIEDISQKNIY